MIQTSSYSSSYDQNKNLKLSISSRASGVKQFQSSNYCKQVVNRQPCFHLGDSQRYFLKRNFFKFFFIIIKCEQWCVALFLIFLNLKFLGRAIVAPGQVQHLKQSWPTQLRIFSIKYLIYDNIALGTVLYYFEEFAVLRRALLVALVSRTGSITDNIGRQKIIF